jgi:hypothetical protein
VALPDIHKEAASPTVTTNPITIIPKEANEGPVEAAVESLEKEGVLCKKGEGDTCAGSSAGT